MKCALPECDLEAAERSPHGGVQPKFCSKTHSNRAAARRRDAKARGEVVSPDDLPGRTRTALLAQALADNGIDLNEIGNIKTAKVSKWNAIVGGEKTDMNSCSLVLSPTWDEGPKWPVIQPAYPVTVKVPAAPRKKGLPEGWKTALILPDPQFGFRRDLYSGDLDPFHDVKALDLALQIAEIERPDLTIWLGDVLDLAPASIKHPQEAGFALTIQPAIDTAYMYLAQFAALSGETRMLEGNHDRRLADLLRANAMCAFGLRRGGATPEDWPVLSVPNLLRLDELGIEYVGGYPAGCTYINDNLACIHGTKVGNNIRSSASDVVEDERVSVITGHVHRIETRYKTRNTRGAPKITFAHTPGCLARIDGAVPSTKGGTDDFGRAVRSWEDWQQGVCVVRYQEGDGKYARTTTPLLEGWAVHRDRYLESRV